MTYADYLIDLMQPLRFYDFSEGSFSRGESEALGASLDEQETALDKILREAILMTALDEGLEQYESLLPRRPAAGTTEGRRAALAALLSIGGDGFTLAALNTALSGCGTTAQVAETGVYDTVQVAFPGCMGVPADFSEMQRIIEDILPCHLAVSYFFRYLTWSDITDLDLIFSDLGAMSWAGLETYDIYA